MKIEPMKCAFCNQKIERTETTLEGEETKYEVRFGPHDSDVENNPDRRCALSLFSTDETHFCNGTKENMDGCPIWGFIISLNGGMKRISEQIATNNKVLKSALTVEKIRVELTRDDFKRIVEAKE